MPNFLYCATGARAPFGAPVWKPFLNRREMVPRYRMRPVPVVFLRLAFSDQLTVFRVTLVSHLLPLSFSLTSPLPNRRSNHRDREMRTLANLGGRVSARGAGLGLVVERTATAPAAEAVGLVVPVVAVSSGVERRRSRIVGIYRLPKLEVPFAVQVSATPSYRYGKDGMCDGEGAINPSRSPS